MLHCSESTAVLSLARRLAFGLRMKERLRLFLRSILWEGEKMIPQPAG